MSSSPVVSTNDVEVEVSPGRRRVTGTSVVSMNREDDSGEDVSF
jgi:hypothetical protein